MASAKNNSEPKVTRIQASDSKKVTKKNPKVAVNGKTEVKKDRKPKTPTFLRGLIGYFKGAWYEIRQVRWPNRSTTWKMTGALLLFTAIFTTFILLIDVFFEYLFKLIVR